MYTKLQDKLRNRKITLFDKTTYSLSSQVGYWTSVTCLLLILSCICQLQQTFSTILLSNYYPSTIVIVLLLSLRSYNQYSVTPGWPIAIGDYETDS